MKIEIPQTLKDLANLFEMKNEKLYLVGGFVRNALLGFCETDLDICGRLKHEEVENLLKHSVFSVKLINKTLGTLHIKSKISMEEFEYTTWRQESYLKGGNHTPTKIKFIKDMNLDVKRRDFTCNAIYYDILGEKYVDLCDGVMDCMNHIIRTVDLPEKTFDDDGLRILRMVRMSCELDFDIEKETFAVAKEKVSNLKDISQERFNKEVISILFSDYKYDYIKNPHSPTNGVNLLCKLGAFGYIFRELSFTSSVGEINQKLDKPWAHFLSFSPSIHRISVFTYEILKALDLEINKENIEKILGQYGLMLSKKEITLQSKLLCGIEKMKTIQNQEIPPFVQKNSKILLRMLDLARIFGVGENIRSVYKIMIEDKVPMDIKSLAINGDDLIKNFKNLPRNKFSLIFDELMYECAFMPELNTKQKLLNYVKGKYL